MTENRRVRMQAFDLDALCPQADEDAVHQPIVVHGLAVQHTSTPMTQIARSKQVMENPLPGVGLSLKMQGSWQALLFAKSLE
jgi:hypothetical protein